MKLLITFLSASFFSSCLWLLLVSSLCNICFCNHNSDRVQCLPSERLALVDIKSNLIDPANRLSSWVGKDCCTWSGVVCDNFTGHVHEIRLRGPDDGIHGHCNALDDTEDVALSHMLGGTISPSVIKLLQLRHLDLSCNDFGSNPIPAFIGSLQNLIYLNISSSNFGGEIPHQLGNLTTLRVLDLYSSYSLYKKSLKWLKDIKGLQFLDMSTIELSKALDWFSVISNLTSLFEIHFSSCGLVRLPGNSTIVSLTPLIVLDLSYNNFHDSMLPGWIFSIRNLASLDLTDCGISGVTHGGFHSMPSLRALRLSGNTFVNSSSLVKGLSSLSNLRLLDVSACDISSPILGSLQNLSFIEYLDLSSNQIVEEIPKSFSNRCNFTTLDLQSNKFYGNAYELLETFCECESPKLELLSLRDNHLIGQLPERLGKLKYLSTIDLTSNQLSGGLPDSLGSLSLLQTLEINSNVLSGSIPNTIGGLSSLVSLDLSENMLSGSLPESIGRLDKLSSLDLSYNMLSGSLPESIGRLDKLSSLDLSYNMLSGSIPKSIGRLGRLSSLDLSYNMLSGCLPKSIGRLGKLSSLILDHNSLTCIVTENHFVNLTTLTTLWARDNKLLFKLNVNKWIPPFKLSSLMIASCSVGPQFPSWIKSQTELTELDMANTSISDTIPKWFWTTFTSVRYLNISHNNIRGKLGDISFFGLEAVLDLSNNHLNGMLPGNFNKVSLFIDLSNNNLSGSLEPFSCSGIEEQREISLLNLANNSMSGVIPNCWMNWPSLIVLNLEKNQFSGVIPSSLGDISSLLSLNMNGNKLHGNLPPWLLNSSSLIIIKLAENELIGKIPSSIGRDTSSFRVLSLRSNKLEGNIPDEICHLSSIQIMDLAHNNLSGNLPTCFTNFSVISGSEAACPIDLYGTTIPDASLVAKGNTYKYSTILYQVTSLDLSNNKFSGSIPNEVVQLSGLRFLNLSHNDLSGTIPNLFNKTGKLECLDLSMNRLNGNIPISLSQLPALDCLNLSYNNLVGRIPTGPQFQTFNETSFTGNALCGAPLPVCLSNNVAIEGSNNVHDELDGIDWILVILTLAGVVVGFWIMVIPLFLSRRWRKTYYHFLDECSFKLQTFVLILFLCLTKRSSSTI